VWSVGELAQAIALATTSQFLASFVWGCGVSPEMVGGGEEGRSSTPESSRAAGASESPGCTLIEGDEETTRVVEKLKRGVSCWKSDEVDMLEEFKKAGEVVESITEGESEVEKAGGVAEDLMRYLKTSRGVEIVQHEDFSVHSKDYDIFHVEEYNWEDNAVPQLDRCYRGMGSLLDSEFRTMFNLTYNTFNNEKEMDTQPFRHAIWFYVQRISGIFNDDYDYQEVNHMLHRGLKTYCKKVCFTPTMVTYEGFLDLGVNLAPEEKCHALLIALEARKQASLLWALRAMGQR